MNSTWIRIGCAVLGVAALAGCQQDRDADDTDVTVTARGRMEADDRDRAEFAAGGGRAEVGDEEMSDRAARVARTQFSGARSGDMDSVVSSSGETYYAAEVRDGQVIFDENGLAWTDPIPDVSGADEDVTIRVIEGTN